MTGPKIATDFNVADFGNFGSVIAFSSSEPAVDTRRAPTNS